MHVVPLLLALIAQRPDSFTAGVREYITVDTSLVALTHVLLVDGTGAAPKSDQTIVIRGGGPGAGGRTRHGHERLDRHPRHRRHARPSVLYGRGRPGRPDGVHWSTPLSGLGRHDDSHDGQSRTVCRD